MFRSMARAPRIDTKRLDVDGFEAWLRSQLSGAALTAVVVVIMQVVRALLSDRFHRGHRKVWHGCLGTSHKGRSEL